MSDVFSDIKVFPNKSNHPVVKGNGSVLIGGLVEVRFTIMQGKNGIFASLPAEKGSKPDDTGKIPYYPRVRIPNKDLYGEFQTLVCNEFRKAMGQGDNSGAGEGDQSSDGLPF
jgi:hypothetical protein